MEWIKYDKKSKPKKNKEYLCVVVTPHSAYGGYQRRVVSLRWDDFSWSCENMIVAYWTEMPELPEEIVL